MRSLCLLYISLYPDVCGFETSEYNEKYKRCFCLMPVCDEYMLILKIWYDKGISVSDVIL